MSLREIEFRYVVQHIGTGNIEIKHYFLSQIEKKPLKELSPAFWEDYRTLSRDQFTGIRSTLGEKLYENDLVEFNDFSYLRTGGNIEDNIVVGKIVFLNGLWTVENEEGCWDLYEAVINDDELIVVTMGTLGRSDSIRVKSILVTEYVTGVKTKLRNDGINVLI